MKKYEEGLTDEELDEQIKKVGSLIPKENENSNNQLVIVDGHIFEIDRSVPKIINYKGPADGIIITAQVSQNGNWQNPVATVTGTITKYGGGTVVSSSATAKVLSTGTTSTVEGFPTVGGIYTIPNITEDTDITITAQDSEGNEPVTETIKVRLVRDITGPIIKSVNVKAEGLKIIIDAKAEDNESGLKEFEYSIEPTTELDKTTGIFTQGNPAEVASTIEETYIVTIIARDNAGNETVTQSGPVTTEKSISLADAKENVNGTTLEQYIGMKVYDYIPKAKGTWRVFYYDTEGSFGPKNTLYLKRDYDENYKVQPNLKTDHIPSDDGELMRALNPEWASRPCGTIDTDCERFCTWLTDKEEWTDFLGEGADYAFGAASAQMTLSAASVGWKRPSNLYYGLSCYWNGELAGYCLERNLNNGMLKTSIPILDITKAKTMFSGLKDSDNPILTCSPFEDKLSLICYGCDDGVMKEISSEKVCFLEPIAAILKK